MTFDDHKVHLSSVWSDGLMSYQGVRPLSDDYTDLLTRREKIL